MRNENETTYNLKIDKKGVNYYDIGIIIEF